MFKTLTEYQIARWNAFVADSWRFVREEGRHFVFLHPTKGYRKVSKARILG